MEEYKEIKLHILLKMKRRRVWQHKHTSIHNLPKSMPDHLKNSKLIKKVISDLLKEETLLSKPTEYGLEVSLNIKKKKEIEKYLEENQNGS